MWADLTSNNLPVSGRCASVVSHEKSYHPFNREPPCTYGVGNWVSHQLAILNKSTFICNSVIQQHCIRIGLMCEPTLSTPHLLPYQLHKPTLLVLNSHTLDKPHTRYYRNHLQRCLYKSVFRRKRSVFSAFYMRCKKV